MSVKSMDGKSVIRKTLPLIISLVLIIAIAILATVLSKEKVDPTITNPDESFVTIGDYSVTNGTVYRNLKVNYGLFELQNLIDRNLLKDYLSKVDDGAVQARINKAIYDNTSNKSMTDKQVELRMNSLTKEERELVEEAFRDSQYLIGLRTEQDIWNYYKLEEAKKLYALDKFKADIAEYEREQTEKQGKEVSYFTDLQIEDYFDDHYEPNIKALVVFFESETEALEAMKAAGVQRNTLGTKWIKYDPERPDAKSGSDLDIEDFGEILEAFIKMYNQKHGYYDWSSRTPIKAGQYDLENYTIDDSVEANKYVKINYNYEDLSLTNASLASQIFKTLMVYEKLGEDEELTNEDFYSDDFHKAYTKKPSTDSNGRYYLAIKLAITSDIEIIDNVRDEIKAALPEKNLTDAKINEKILQLRRDAGLVIYDKFLERNYAGGDTEFKTTKKTKTHVVAEYKVGNEVIEVTADQLFEILALTYAPKEIAKIMNQEILVRDETYNKVYDVENGTILDKKEYEKFKELVLGYRNAFAQGYFAQMGFPPSYGWKNFMRDNFGVESQKDLIVPLALFNHTLDKYREASYTVEDVIEQMKKAVDEFFEAKIMNIVISVDYDNNSQPDKNIVGKIDLEQSNWTQAQKDLVPALVDTILEEKSKVITGNDHVSALKAVVEKYNNVSVNDPDYNTWKVFKEAGLRIEYEDYQELTNNKTAFVEEFLNETKKLWNIAKAEGLLGKMTNPIWAEEAFESSYGFHYIGISSASDYTYADPEEKLLLTDMEIEELKALIALYERELESKEDEDKPLTDEEKEEIEEKLTAEVRAAFTKYYTPAIQYLEEYNSSNSGRLDLELAKYRADKGITFANSDIAAYYLEVLAINKKTHDKAYNLDKE